MPGRRVRLSRREFKAAMAGRAVADPLCMAPHLALSGRENERALELAPARILILQAECGNVVLNGTAEVGS